MKKLRIKGRVFSGKGKGAKFTRLPWVEGQIREKLGFTPYPGTLNLKLTEKDVENRASLEEVEAQDILPTSGFNRGRLFRAYLRDDVKCAVVIPQIPGYPDDVVEIISQTNLREKLKLEDGQSVEVDILLG